MNEFKHILLAEDDLNDIELTLEALEEHNLANIVEVVRDGEEALDYLYVRGKFKARTSKKPILILLDIKMPKVDGIQVLKTIKTDKILKMIPVVMLSSSQEESDLIQSYYLGANAYVVKPVEIHQFIDAIQKIGIFWALVNQPPPDQVII